MALIVRPAVPSDAPTIVEFNRRLALETEQLVLEPTTLANGVHAVLEDAVRGLYFVAEEDNEILGQIMITYEWSDWRNGWIWWIQSVYVSPKARNRGVFRAIFDYVTQRGSQAGNVVGLRLYVEQKNFVAQQTYRRLGFEQIHFDLYQKIPM